MVCCSAVRATACVALMLVTAAYAGQVLGPITASSTDRFLRDEFGRVRIFHGANAVQKGFPWYPESIVNNWTVPLMESIGFNAMRFGLMWTGTEPEEGQWNETYLSISESMVDLLGSYGIYSFLDMHQDVLSSKFCEYDGAPLWLVNRSEPTHAFPWPLSGTCYTRGWADNYLAAATGRAFQDIYDNNHGMMDSMIKFWTKVASTFRTNTNVLGYELINEPWAGDWVSNPFIMLPGNADAQNLLPLYNNLTAAIRAVDPDHLIFYEPVTWGQVLPDALGGLGMGFDSVPGGPEFKNRSVLSWHYYCWPFQGTNGPYKYVLVFPLRGRSRVVVLHSNFTRTICDSLLGPDMFNNVILDLQRTGGSSFLTEFGLCSPNNNLTSANTIECDFVMDLADKTLQSWTYWDFTGGNCFNYTDQTLNRDAAQSFARTYARAIAGVPLNMTFDPTSGNFEFAFTMDTTITQPTEVWLHEAWWYPKGFVVKTSSNLQYQHADTNILHFTPSSVARRASQAAEIATIQITPA